MVRKKTAAASSKALAALEPQPLAGADTSALAASIGSREALAKIIGTGGEIFRQDGVTRVSGRDYATSDGPVPAAEIYFAKDGMPKGEGPWLGEADKVAWVDPATGLECIMLRDHPRGFLSGYVGVGAEHPLFGWDHRAVPADLGIEVHGGLTYSRICDEGPSPALRLIRESRRICHVVVGEVPLKHATDHRASPHQWWFGFDCDHLYDVVPGELQDRRDFKGAGIEARYRDDGYVVREIKNLAVQLAAIRDGRPVPAREGPPLPPMGLDPEAG
jgi:hypothetical protein